MKNKINMKRALFIILGLIVSFGFGFYVKSITIKNNILNMSQNDIKSSNKNAENIKLGAFSVSLNVKDIMASKEFYESLGFVVFGGDIEQNYLIMKNENTLIGLFQGMFQGNILTFNPGWDENANNLDDFNDVREIQKHLKNKGLITEPEVDKNTSGPASFMLNDPDGNVLLFDQHR